MPRSRPVTWLAFVLLSGAAASSSGCTVCLWNDVGWPVARKECDRIDAAAVDDAHVLFLRLVRRYSGPELWAVDLALLRRQGQAELRVAGSMPPASSAPLHILTDAEQEAYGRGELPVASLDQGSFQVGLYASRTKPAIAVWFPEDPGKAKLAALPEPPIAWFSPNAFGHVLVTPAAVVADVVVVPVCFILLITGVIPSK